MGLQPVVRPIDQARGQAVGPAPLGHPLSVSWKHPPLRLRGLAQGNVHQRHAFQGECVVFVKATAAAGQIQVRATAAGLEAGAVSLTAVSEPTK